MNNKRALAAAMSALMIMSSTPTAALAAELNQAQGAKPAAVTAGLKPGSANAEKSLKAALDDASGAKTTDKATSDKAAATKATTTAAAEKPATTAATTTAAAEKPATTAAATTAAADADKAAKAETAEAANKADAAATTATAATTKAAAAPAAEAAAQAPAFKLADHLYDYGTLSYKFVDENGNEVNSDSASLFKIGADGITASDPVEQDGRWVATLKIDASKVDPANFAPSWAVSDPEDYELDASQSKLTVEYKTDSTNPGATSYYATGSDRGSLVFVKKAAKPAEPTLDVKDSAGLSQADLASAQSIYDLFGVSAKDAQGTEVADTEVDTPSRTPTARATSRATG